MPSAPVGFGSKSADVNGFRMHYLIGGQGSPVVLVHGAFDSWYAWREIADELSRTHTVIVPAIRGLAESGKPLSGYDGDTLGDDLFVLLSGLGYDAVHVVGHDWGGQAAFTLAAQHRDFVTKLAIFEWAIPGTGHIEAAMSPRANGHFLWHMGLMSVPDIPEVLLRNKPSALLRLLLQQLRSRARSGQRRSTQLLHRSLRAPRCPTRSEGRVVGQQCGQEAGRLLWRFPSPAVATANISDPADTMSAGDTSARSTTWCSILSEAAYAPAEFATPRALPDSVA